MKNFLSLVKFAHTIFALPFALVGYFLAVTVFQEGFQWPDLAKVLLAMVFARNAAMGFNRYTDRQIDAQNERTSMREIPAGKISNRAAGLFVILNVVAFILTTWFINALCFYLSFVAMAVVLGYSLTKRFTWLCHFILGLGLSLAPVGAFIAVTGYFALAPVIVGLAVFFWVTGFDIIYALQDVAFDREQGLFSVPAFFGQNKALWLARVIHFFSALLVFYAGTLISVHWFYYLGAFLFSGLLFYQHLIVKADDLSRVNIAFFTTNGIASLFFSLIAIVSFYL